ncbi:MAG: YcgN family cysteine cluster protein [Gammaproteobacteria bacterium]
MENFWETKSLQAMTEEEWEQLCDNCGRCCLIKLEDIDTDELHYTNIVCQYHDSERCQCTRYQERSWLVPDCIKVTPEVAATQSWLPDTCAYRLLAEGKPLPDWHPLNSGLSSSIHSAGISIRDAVVSEVFVHPDEYVEHLISFSDNDTE